MRSTDVRMFFLGVVCLASAALAPTSAQAVEAYLASTIKVVYPLGNGSFILKFNQNSPSCLGPENPQIFYVTVGQNGVTAEGARNILAAALTAYVTQSPVSMAFDTATTSCFVNRLSLGE